MVRCATARLDIPNAPPAGTPPWRARLDEIAAILAQGAPPREQVVRAIEAEAGGRLPRDAVERLADRVAGLLAA